MNFEDIKENFDWSTIGQVYGILSRFAFIIEKSEYIDNKYIRAFQEAEDSLRNDELNLDAFEILIEGIKIYRGTDYRLDILDIYKDDDIEILEDDDDIEILDMKSDNSILSDIEKERIKKIVKEISNIVDEVANEGK